MPKEYRNLFLIILALILLSSYLPDHNIKLLFFRYLYLYFYYHQNGLKIPGNPYLIPGNPYSTKKFPGYCKVKWQVKIVRGNICPEQIWTSDRVSCGDKCVEVMHQR